MADKGELELKGTVTIECEGQKIEMSLDTAKDLMRKLQTIFGYGYSPIITYTGLDNSKQTDVKVNW
jgi:hypothetical protein